MNGMKVLKQSSNKLLRYRFSVQGRVGSRDLSSASTNKAVETGRKVQEKVVEGFKDAKNKAQGMDVHSKLLAGLKIDPKAAGLAGAGIASMILLAASGSSEKDGEKDEMSSGSLNGSLTKPPTTEKSGETIIGEGSQGSEGNEQIDIALGRILDRLDHIEARLFVEDAKNVQRAFMFIKPHALKNSIKSIDLVRSHLKEHGIQVKQEGDLTAEDIEKGKIIDKHYGAIASKAVKMDPKELNVPEKGKADFHRMFNESWDDALKKGKVYNAAQARKKLKVNGKELGEMYDRLERGKNLVKFSGGFYCGKLTDDMYVINGFYMSMREGYTTEPAVVHYLAIEWDPRDLSWEKFRKHVLGDTNPETAEPQSLRNKFLKEWEDLELPDKPNTGDNGVHASASPFEAMCERVNWLGTSLDQDPFARAVLKSGVDAKTLMEFMEDPQVQLDDTSTKTSVFDYLEDSDSGECLDKLVSLAKNKN